MINISPEDLIELILLSRAIKPPKEKVCRHIYGIKSYSNGKTSFVYEKGLMAIEPGEQVFSIKKCEVCPCCGEML